MSGQQTLQYGYDPAHQTGTAAYLNFLARLQFLLCQRFMSVTNDRIEKLVTLSLSLTEWLFAVWVMSFCWIALWAQETFIPAGRRRQQDVAGLNGCSTHTTKQLQQIQHWAWIVVVQFWFSIFCSALIMFELYLAADKPPHPAISTDSQGILPYLDTFDAATLSHQTARLLCGAGRCLGNDVQLPSKGESLSEAGHGDLQKT